MHGEGERRVLSAVTLAAAITLVGWVTGASAQTPDPAPSSLPDALPAHAADDLSPAKLLERLRKMEETVNALHDQNQELQLKYNRISEELEDTKKRITLSPADARGTTRSYDEPAIMDDPFGPGTDGHVPTEGRSTQNEGGFTKDFDEQGVGNRRIGELPLIGRYSYGNEGIQFESEDAELFLKFRYLVQADMRYFSPANESPVTDGFYFPRGRLYFDGRVTKPIEYQISFQQAYDNFNLLNAFLHFNYDKRLQFRIGDSRHLTRMSSTRSMSGTSSPPSGACTTSTLP